MRHADGHSGIKFALCLAACVVLSGCVSRDMTDLENYAADVLSRPGGRIEPLPPIKPYEPYLYQSSGRLANTIPARDPFRSFFAVEPQPVAGDPGEECDALCQEIKTHNKEELELFELDSLRMVGIMENNNELWGIIRDVDGTVHRVQVGNYLGANYGKILNIQEDRIDIREIIQNEPGKYEERSASLALSEE